MVACSMLRAMPYVMSHVYCRYNDVNNIDEKPCLSTFQINNNINKFFIADNCPYTYKKYLKYRYIYINNAFPWN